MPDLAKQIPDQLLELFQIFQQHGQQAWLAGGCLRDLLMGNQPKDWDVATSAKPEQVCTIFKRVIPTGIKHGTVTVLWRGHPIEVTTLRGERGYSDGRRPDEVFYVQDIVEDLARRDFTMNAIAYDPLQNNLIDPFAGQVDIASKLIRCVGKPDERFREDGLRALRAARFCATLEFELEPATQAAIAGALDVFAKVSCERVQAEWAKTLVAKQPSSAFHVMLQTGLLGITLPELVTQKGCQQNRFHCYDVWEHTLRCVDEIAPTLELRLAALLHDLGKPSSRQWSEKSSDYSFHHHESIGAKMADQWLRSYRFPTQLRRKVVHLIQCHLVCYEPQWTDAAVRRFINRVGPEHLEDLFALARADAIAKGFDPTQELEKYAELTQRIEQMRLAHNALGISDLAVDGNILMQKLSLPPSRQIGDILKYLMAIVIEDPDQNQLETLVELAQQYLREQSAS